MKTKVTYTNIDDSYNAGLDLGENINKDFNPKIGLLFNTINYDEQKLIEGIKAKNINFDIVGCTTSAGIITQDGYMIDDTIASILALEDDDLITTSYGMKKIKSARETGRRVAKKALEKINIDYAPDYFFMTANPKDEEEYIKGIQDIIGRVPCFGGSAADNTTKGNWKIIYNENIFKEGLAVVFFYTDKEIKTKFTSPYKETEDMGIITKVKNKNTLVEIDNKKVLDIYKQWNVKEEITKDNILTKSIKKPLGIKDRLGDLTVIYHPMNINEDESITLGKSITEKTALIQMETTEEEIIKTTINTIKELNNNSSGYLLIQSAFTRLILKERMTEIYEQIKQEVGNIPFLVIFTFGEYGYTDDQTNNTGNLMFSFNSFEK